MQQRRPTRATADEIVQLIVSAKGEHQWLTLRGDVVDLGYPAYDSMSDRVLYETLMDWWQERSPPINSTSH